MEAFHEICPLLAALEVTGELLLFLFTESPMGTAITFKTFPNIPRILSAKCPIFSNPYLAK